MPENTSITNSDKYELENKKGYYEFGVIVFTAPGEYEYVITESGKVDGVTNDPDASKGKTIKFTVTESENGSLSVDPTTDQVELSFTNTYSKEGPKTGDSNNMTLWMIIMALAAISGATGVILFKKSKKRS